MKIKARRIIYCCAPVRTLWSVLLLHLYYEKSIFPAEFLRFNPEDFLLNSTVLIINQYIEISTSKVNPAIIVIFILIRSRVFDYCSLNFHSIITFIHR